MRVAYTGHEALTFTDYIDLEAGKTLHAEPGGVYDIAPASGRNVLEVHEPWFAAVAGEAPAPQAWAAEPDAVPEPVSEPDPESQAAEEVPAE